MSATNTDWATDAEPGGQRVPDAQRPRHADGRSAAPLLDAGAAVARNCPSATARPRRSGSWARTCWPSAPPTAGSASSSRTARIAAPTSITAATRSAACAAPSTAGSSTSTATASTCRPRRRNPSYKDTIKLLAYPTREWGDMIWVYMGPRETMPELPQLEMGLVPAAQRYVSKKWQDCNWVQSLEGGIDTAHFSFLHAVLTKDEKEALAIYSRSAALGDQSRPDDRVRWIRNDPRPKFSILGHDAGLVIGGARKTDSGRSLLAHRPVPDAQPRLRAGRDAGRGLLRPGLGAGRATPTAGSTPTAGGPTAPSPTPSARSSPAASACMPRSTTTTCRCATSDNDYLIDRAAAEDHELHRHHRRQRAGRGDPGQPGPDPGPHARASRPDRSRHRRVPQARHGRGAGPAAGRASRRRHRLRRNMPCAPAPGSPGRTRISPQVMTERFGHRHGYVGNEYGLGE